eukprot:6063975-Prymnesium_polylepis.1
MRPRSTAASPTTSSSARTRCARAAPAARRPPLAAPKRAPIVPCSAALPCRAEPPRYPAAARGTRRAPADARCRVECAPAARAAPALVPRRVRSCCRLQTHEWLQAANALMDAFFAVRDRDVEADIKIFLERIKDTEPTFTDKEEYFAHVLLGFQQRMEKADL